MQLHLAESRFDCVPVVWRCFSTDGFDAQGPGCIMKQQTARHESHALQRYRVLDFVDQFGFLHSEHCHGRARSVENLGKRIIQNFRPPRRRAISRFRPPPRKCQKYRDPKTERKFRSALFASQWQSTACRFPEWASKSNTRYLLNACDSDLLVCCFITKPGPRASIPLVTKQRQTLVTFSIR